MSHIASATVKKAEPDLNGIPKSPPIQDGDFDLSARAKMVGYTQAGYDNTERV